LPSEKVTIGKDAFGFICFLLGECGWLMLRRCSAGTLICARGTCIIQHAATKKAALLFTLFLD
jgi:hypothetical protein